MNWVPLLFIDDVCHQLNKPKFNQVSQLSGSWSEFGAEHHKKRREFDFRCGVSNQEVSYGLRDLKFRCGLNRSQEVIYNSLWAYPRIVTVADLNLEFDRITYFTCDSKYFDHRVSLREFERDVLSTIAPLVMNCCWQYLSPQRRDRNRIFFNAFKNFPGFNIISVAEQGQESRDFLARQVRLGNVQTLNLIGTDRWPEEENLGETLKIFVSSARFHELYSPDLLIDDYELFELFLKRALAKELNRGARFSAPITNLDKSRFLALRPECHDDSEKDAWRIPDSNLRIALRYRDDILFVRVE